MAKKENIAFIGAGKMATAITISLVSKGIAPEKIRAFDVSEHAAKLFSATTGCETTASLHDALKSAGTVLLAVKPQFAADVLREANVDLKGKLLISIAAGMKLANLIDASASTHVIRVMPNTPALVRQGMSCFACAKDVTEEERAFTTEVLSSFGIVREVPESLLDAVTGLSGSGPAFVIEFIYGLIEGGVYCGMPRELATEAAIQTVLGTAKMCQKSPKLISDLRNAVITPSGTTSHGIHSLDKAGFRGIVADAVIAAAERSAQLGAK